MFLKTEWRELSRRRGIEGPKSPSWTIRHEEGQGFRQFSPVAPMMEGGKAVSPHDPDEIGPWQERLQSFQCFGRHSAAYSLFEIGCDEAGMGGELLRKGHSVREILRVLWVFEWILGGHEPPHPVESCRFQGFLGNSKMALVGRIEGASV